MAPVVTTVSDNYTWATLFLNDLGVPASQNNINNVLLWMAQEKPPQAWSGNNNPLNNTYNAKSYKYGNYTDYYYDTISEAATQTANNIALDKTSNANGYGNIYNALANNANTATLSAAILDSKWGTKTPLTQTKVPSKYPYIGTFTGSTNTAQGVVPSTNTSAVPGCSQKGDLLNLGVFKITGCQGKALLGGLFVVSGAILILVGISFVIKTETLNGIKEGLRAPAAE